MKAAYAPVMEWVRFHAWVVQSELQLCNASCIAPWSRPLLKDQPEADRPDAILGMLEELATVVWLLEQERIALLERLREMFAPKAPLALPPEITAMLVESTEPVEAMELLRNSIAARASLIDDHPMVSDPHTRLILYKHRVILREMIIPTLGRVIGLARENVPPSAPRKARPTEDLLDLYSAFLPKTPRMHLDTFLRLSLLNPSSTYQ
jgi:hypothetical protein